MVVKKQIILTVGEPITFVGNWTINESLQVADVLRQFTLNQPIQVNDMESENDSNSS